MKMKKHAGLSCMVVLKTRMGWKQRCARPGLCNFCELIDHLGSLKSALVRVFTSWKLVTVRNQSPLPPLKSKLLNFASTTTSWRVRRALPRGWNSS